jgi:hypothetical protein
MRSAVTDRVAAPAPTVRAVLRAAVRGGGGRKPAKLTPASEYLEDEDLLEILNAGLIPTVVVDGHKATFWKRVLPKIVIRVRFYHAGPGRIQSMRR